MLTPRSLDWETISRIFAVQALIKHWQPQLSPPPPRIYCDNCANGWGCIYTCNNVASDPIDPSVQEANTEQIDLATIGDQVDRIFQ